MGKKKNRGGKGGGATPAAPGQLDTADVEDNEQEQEEDEVASPVEPTVPVAEGEGTEASSIPGAVEESPVEPEAVVEEKTTLPDPQLATEAEHVSPALKTEVQEQQPVAETAQSEQPAADVTASEADDDDAPTAPSSPAPASFATAENTPTKTPVTNDDTPYKTPPAVATTPQTGGRQTPVGSRTPVEGKTDDVDAMRALAEQKSRRASEAIQKLNVEAEAKASTPKSNGGGVPAAAPQTTSAEDSTFEGPVEYEHLIAGSTTMPSGVVPHKRESYLSDEEFLKVLGMPKPDFYKLPKWKQEIKKKETKLW
eukprot:jgi/Chlat1/808/Chrsp104S01273